MNGPTVLGKMWRKATRRWLTPRARAASTYWNSRMLSTLARMTRAARGMMGIEMARITFWMEGPRAADMTRASTRRGRPCRISMTRWMARSVLPRCIPREAR